MTPNSTTKTPPVTPVETATVTESPVVTIVNESTLTPPVTPPAAPVVKPTLPFSALQTVSILKQTIKGDAVCAWSKMSTLLNDHLAYKPHVIISSVTLDMARNWLTFLNTPVTKVVDGNQVVSYPLTKSNLLFQNSAGIKRVYTREELLDILNRVITLNLEYANLKNAFYQVKAGDVPLPTAEIPDYAAYE